MQRVGGLGLPPSSSFNPPVPCYSALLIVSGIGLLGMKPWGRWLAVVYAVYCTLMSLARPSQVVIANPVEARIAWEQSPLAGAVDNPQLGVTLWNVLSVAWGLVSLAFAFVVLVILSCRASEPRSPPRRPARREEEGSTPCRARRAWMRPSTGLRRCAGRSASPC
jgi:hypothetical protein